MNNVSNVSNLNALNGVNFGAIGGAKNTNLLKQNAPEDSFELQSKASGRELSVEDKQEIIQKARQKSSGWAVFGGIFSTLYYGLRSDEKVAKKFDLDAEKDKKLVKQIKREQMLWTIPALVPGFGVVPGALSYLYNRNMDPAKIKVAE